MSLLIRSVFCKKRFCSSSRFNGFPLPLFVLALDIEVRPSYAWGQGRAVLYSQLLLALDKWVAFPKGVVCKSTCRGAGVHYYNLRLLSINLSIDGFLPWVGVSLCRLDLNFRAQVAPPPSASRNLHCRCSPLLVLFTLFSRGERKQPFLFTHPSCSGLCRHVVWSPSPNGRPWRCSESEFPGPRCPCCTILKLDCSFNGFVNYLV